MLNIPIIGDSLFIIIVNKNGLIPKSCYEKEKKEEFEVKRVPNKISNYFSCVFDIGLYSSLFHVVKVRAW